MLEVAARPGLPFVRRFVECVPQLGCCFVSFHHRARLFLVNEDSRNHAKGFAYTTHPSVIGFLGRKY
jgi:hypothetical protein